MSELMKARAKLREQLDWRGPSGRAQGITTLTRAEAEAILEGPVKPLDVLDEIGRLALKIPKEEIERYAEEGGMNPDFICSGGKPVRSGERCRHCGAQPTGDECNL